MSGRRLFFEKLERRQLLAVFAAPWPEPGDLTLSFAPDGTSASGMPTSLFQTLHRLPTDVWQETTLRAFQTWAVNTNANVRLASDGGQPFGTLGLKQGDPRFGDIRIGAVPLASDVLAVADPYDAFVASTWVGDVLLNSAFLFDTSGDPFAYDLFSVMLHEAGHVFGVGHSNDPNSPMFASLEKIATVLTPQDIAAVQAVFGGRPADRFEGAAGNDAPVAATRVSLLDEHGQPWMTELDGDLGVGDVDVFRVTLPAGISTLAVRMEASERSLLTARVTVLDDAGNVLATDAAHGPLDNDFTLLLASLSPGRDYFVRIEQGRDDVFGIGGYRIEFDTAWERPSGYGAEEESVPFSPHEERLMATTPGYVEHTYYEMYDSFTLATPAHLYRVRSADLGPELTNVMTVVVDWETAAAYEVVIRDDAGDVIVAETVYDGPGHLAVQIPTVLSDRDYLVEVRGKLDRPLDPDDEYGFEVTVDFAQDGQHLLPLLIDQMAPQQTHYSVPFTVSQSQEYHFVLSASDWNAPAETGVRLEILDAEGEMVAASTAADGASRTADVLLSKGQYTLVFSRDSSTTDTTLMFQLDSISLSTPLGPQLRDTVRNPIDRSTALALTQLDQYWGAVALRTPGHTASTSRTSFAASERLPLVLALAQPGIASQIGLRAPRRDQDEFFDDGAADRREGVRSPLPLTPARYTPRVAKPPQSLRRAATDAGSAPEQQHASTDPTAGDPRPDETPRSDAPTERTRTNDDRRGAKTSNSPHHSPPAISNGDSSESTDSPASSVSGDSVESLLTTLAVRVALLLQLGWLGVGWRIWRRRRRPTQN